MQITGKRFLAEGWTAWSHKCTPAEETAIRRAFVGPIEATRESLIDAWVNAANAVLEIKRGRPARGDRYVTGVTDPTIYGIMPPRSASPE